MTTAPSLRHLGDEPFGWRLRRARYESGIELRTVADLISQLVLVSHTTIARLEKLEAAPADRKQRAVAYLAMLVYGFDPAELGLTADDLPKGLAVAVLEWRVALIEQGMKQSTCIAVSAA